MNPLLFMTAKNNGYPAFTGYPLSACQKSFLTDAQAMAAGFFCLFTPVCANQQPQSLHTHLHGGGGVLAHILVQSGGLPLLVPDHV